MAAFIRWLRNCLCLLSCRKRCAGKTSEVSSETDESKSSFGGSTKRCSSRRSRVEDYCLFEESDLSSGDSAVVQNADIQSGEDHSQQSNAEHPEKRKDQSTHFASAEAAATHEGGDSAAGDSENLSVTVWSDKSSAEEPSGVSEITETESSDDTNQYNKFEVEQLESEDTKNDTEPNSSSADPTSEESETVIDGELLEEKSSENSHSDKSSTDFNTVTNDNAKDITQTIQELKVEYPNLYESVIDIGFNDADKSFEMKFNLDTAGEVLDVVDLFLTDDDPVVPSNDLELSIPKEGTPFCRTVKPDMLIIVGGQEFRGHQSIICAESGYFKHRFVGKENAQIVCQIDSKFVSPGSFQAILTFLYTGDMRATCQQMAATQIAACFLGIDRVQEKHRQMCDISSGSATNAAFLYTTSCHYGLEIPKSRALEIMALNFESLLFENDFLELTGEQIKELLNRDTLGARSEMLVFVAALKWTDHKFLEREELFADADARCVRFSAMSMEEIVSCFHPPILLGMVKQPQVQAMLLNAVCYISSKAVGQEESFKDLKPRERQLLLSGKYLELWDLSAFHPDWCRDRAAVVIQASFRGHAARKRLEESEPEYASFRLRQDFNRRVRQLHASTTQSRSSQVPPSKKGNYGSFLRSLYERRRADAESLE